ncbi:NnrS family protein [Vibrio sp. HN007]|uniref:NnrS family protein n=1 Tax=Vibrio iocasae TaxID=3098914 RepID=UPI0035D45E3A
MLNITDKSKEDRIVPLFRLGFRPFFLLGTLYSIISIVIWVYAFQKGQPEALKVPAIWWHVHEMFFAFAMAIVAGFVLTAVQTWTGVNGTKSYRLAAIVALWALPRILFWTDTPLWITSIIESLFILSVAYEVGFRVVESKGWKNLFFVPLFVLAIVANFASYATIKGMAPFPPSAVWHAMLWWFVLLLSVMGNRVIPFFTARRFNSEKPQPILWLDYAVNISLVLLFALSFFPIASMEFSKPLMLVAGALQLVRFVRWKPWQTVSEPLVWSLHLSYGCIPVGLLLSGFTDGFTQHSMIHLFAIGALGGLILAMIARVTMGHTGRMIYQGPAFWYGFAATFIAAVIRSVGVAMQPESIILYVNIAAGLWVFAFGLYLVKFGHMLATPRADGHPG